MTDSKKKRNYYLINTNSKYEVNKKQEENLKKHSKYVDDMKDFLIEVIIKEFKDNKIIDLTSKYSMLIDRLLLMLNNKIIDNKQYLKKILELIAHMKALSVNNRDNIYILFYDIKTINMEDSFLKKNLNSDYDSINKHHILQISWCDKNINVYKEKNIEKQKKELINSITKFKKEFIKS